MLYEVKVKVESDAIIDEPFGVKVDPHTLVVHCDKNRKVTDFVISVVVLDYQPYLMRLVTDPETGNHTLSEPVNPYFKEMVALLQTVESLGSFWFGIKRVHWDTPTTSWKSENESEERHLREANANHFKLNKSYPREPIRLTPEKLASIVALRNEYEHLKIPMSFYREGRNFFDTQRYIYAFHSFYYYLEDLYADGNTKNRLVQEKFLASEHIRDAVDKTLISFKKNKGHHYQNLLAFLTSEQKIDSVDDVIKLIVSIRGNLHHFSQKSSQKQGHPFNQEEFESMAYLLMSVCVFTYTELTTLQPPQ